MINQFFCISSLLFLFCNPISAQAKFSAETIDPNIQIGYGLAIGDVDGDKLPDIILADKKAFAWYRNPDWKRFTIIENLTEHDNVCLAVRDLDGDDRVEIAVGAQWNPGETSDVSQSGSVHYLIRPEDPTALWQAVALPHEPTVHRMGWIKTEAGPMLIVVPLHGRENKQGQGRGVQVFAYKKPDDPSEGWQQILVDSSMHITHNFDIIKEGSGEVLLIGGKEGSKLIHYQNGGWHPMKDGQMLGQDLGFGEIRKGKDMIVGVQPFHGNQLKVFLPDGREQIITQDLQQGHALACADLVGKGHDQIVVGWREKNAQNQFGIKLFAADNNDWSSWQEMWIDKNEIACEDLKVADLDGDGKLEIIAAGRSTKNLKIYWNKN